MGSQPVDNQTNPESALEETSSQETSPEENAPCRFGTLDFTRFLVLSVAAVWLLTTGPEQVSDVNGNLAEWSKIATDVVALGLSAYACFAVFQRSVVVGKEEIRNIRPLWTNRPVQIGEIRRVHIPATPGGPRLYTDPDGNPALKVGARLEEPGGPQEAGDREHAVGGKDHRTPIERAHVLSPGGNESW
jgi:hypothetical protein